MDERPDLLDRFKPDLDQFIYYAPPGAGVRSDLPHFFVWKFKAARPIYLRMGGNKEKGHE